MSPKGFDVTYLSIDSVQEGVGSSQITPLILGLANKGKRVCLITFEKSAPSSDLVEEFDAAGVTWISKDFGKQGAIAGLKRLNSLRRVIPQSNIFHGRSDIATSAAIWSGVDAPVLWDVRSLWSDQRLIIGTEGWNKFTALGARALEDVSARKSNAMTTLTSAIVPILQQRHKRIPEIRAVIPTSVQTKKFLPSSMPSSQLTCLLSGTFNNYYDIERTKQILDELRRNLDFQVIWARAGESPSETLGVGEDLIVNASHFQMPQFVKDSHFGMAICKGGDLKSLAAAVPTKIGEFLASGRPVIVSEGVGDLDQLLELTGTGIVIGHDQSLVGIADRLSSLISDAETPERCRDLAMQHFDMEKSVDKYLNIYDRMQH